MACWPGGRFRWHAPGGAHDRYWQTRVPARAEEGVGLIEVIIAFTVLALVLVPISYILTSTLSDSGNARTKVAALSVAEKWLESLNNTGPGYTHTIPVVGTTIRVGTSPTHTFTTDAGVKYYAVGRFSWATPTFGSHPDICTSGAVPSVLQLTVTVTWGAGRTSTISDTILTEFPPAGLPKYGFIGVQMERSPTEPTDLASPPSATGSPWGGGLNTRVTQIPVTVTRTPATRAGSPTATYSPQVTHPAVNGCAFVERPPGNYQVSVGPETLVTPFVQPGTTSYQSAYRYPTGPVAVAIDQVTATDFLYDEGAYVNISYPDVTGADGAVSCSTEAGVCLAAGQAPSGLSPDGSTGTVATISTYSSGQWSQVHPLSGLGISKIESTGCASTLCFAAGYGTAGAAVVVHKPATAANAWTAGTLPAPGGLPLSEVVLSEVLCPSSTLCLVMGSGPTGSVVLAGTVATGSVTWTSAGEPSVTLTQLTCPSTTACRAIGSTFTGAGRILSGVPAASGSGTWTWTVADGTLTLDGVTLSRLTCPTTTNCLVAGSASVGPILAVGKDTSASWTWATYSMTSTKTPLPSVSSVSEVGCVSASTCVAVGSGTSGAVILSGKGSVPATWTWTSDTLPSSVGTLSHLTCPTATTCLAAGEGATGAIILSGVLATGIWTWSATTLPTGTESLHHLTCPGTGTCLAVGAGATHAVILSGTPSGASWHLTALPGSPTAPSPNFLAGVACLGTSGACVAAGASSDGTTLLSASKAGTGWSAATPGSGGGGLVAGGLAVSVDSTPTPSFVACHSSSATVDSCTSLGPLFPYTAGYAVGAGTCSAELTKASVQATSTPGAVGTEAPTVVVPLGFLTLEVIGGNGRPIPNARVRATPEDPKYATCNTPAATLTLGRTGRDGSVEVAVMYETYTVTVTTSTATVSRTIRVTPTEVTATGTSYPLPSPVVFVT